MTEHGKLLLLCIIADSKTDELITGSLKKMNCRGIMTAHGRGTARSEMLTTLGLGDTERSVVICVIRADQEERVISRLNRRLRLDLPGHGVLFTIDITSVGGLKTLAYLYGNMHDAAHTTQDNNKTGGV